MSVPSTRESARVGIGRRLQVAASITAVSVVAGAAAGSVVAAGLALTYEAISVLAFDFVGAGALIGAGFGLLLGPTVSLGFLRRVPLGRLFLETALGAALGGLAGLALGFATSPREPGIVAVFPGAIAGFAIASMNLRHRYRAPKD